MNNRIALVTGGSRGIGKAISHQLALDGFFVYVNYSSNEQKALEVVNEIKNKGGQAELCPFNVASLESVEAAFQKILKEKGPLHVLVNNAGINKDSLLIRLKEEDIDTLFSVNLKGAIFCAKEAAKQMMKVRAGSIINISSVVAQIGNAGQSAYVSSKAGLIGFTKSIAKELASRKIRVNAITPGYIQTDMTEVLTEDQKNSILQNVPLGSMGQPEDIAHAVSYLASDKSTYVTGQVLSINGGMVM